MARTLDHKIYSEQQTSREAGWTPGRQGRCESELVSLSFSVEFLGDSSEGETPVPIPNTEVKPLSPDGTALETVWESRTLPGIEKHKGPGPAARDQGLCANLTN